MNPRIDYAFLHGGGQGSWVWDETIAALRQQSAGDIGEVIALDVPGCGKKRGRNTSAMSVDDIVDELLADLESTRIGNVVLVGHSQAGNLMPRLVQKRPELFLRLVYVSCSSPLPGKTVIQMMGASRQATNEDEVGWPFDPTVVRDMSQRYPLMFTNDMNPAHAAQFLATLGRDAWPNASYAATDWRYDHLSNVASSYVACLRDAILPTQWQEKFAERFKVQRLVRIDAGHQAMNTRPQGLAEIIRHEVKG